MWPHRARSGTLGRQSSQWTFGFFADRVVVVAWRAASAADEVTMAALPPTANDTVSATTVQVVAAARIPPR